MRQRNDFFFEHVKMLQITYLVQFFSFFKKTNLFRCKKLYRCAAEGLKTIHERGGEGNGGESPPPAPISCLVTYELFETLT